VRNAYRISFGNPQGKRLVGSSRVRWNYNIKMVLREIASEGVNWTEVA
jgi:hypothetical protein